MVPSTVEITTFEPCVKKNYHPTKLGEPAGDDGVDFVQNNDGDEIDDGGGGFDSGPDVGARRRVRAHVQQRLNGDPIQDDAEDDGKRHRDLEEGDTKTRDTPDGRGSKQANAGSNVFRRFSRISFFNA